MGELAAIGDGQLLKPQHVAQVEKGIALLRVVLLEQRGCARQSRQCGEQRPRALDCVVKAVPHADDNQLLGFVAFRENRVGWRVGFVCNLPDHA